MIWDDKALLSEKRCRCRIPYHEINPHRDTELLIIWPRMVADKNGCGGGLSYTDSDDLAADLQPLDVLSRP